MNLKEKQEWADKWLKEQIPKREQWLYKNKTALKSVEEGLKQKGTHDLGTFGQYLEEGVISDRN